MSPHLHRNRPDATTSAADSPDARPTRARRFAELVILGLAPDPEEILGDLTEGRAHIADAAGERPARGWWWGQAVRAVPRLVWHGLARRPLDTLVGVGALVVFVWLTSLIPVPFGTESGVAPGGTPDPTHVLWDTAVTGAAMLAVGALLGATLARVRRRAPLLPVLPLVALLGLIYSRFAFYTVYGPGRTWVSEDGMHQGGEVELGPWSTDVVVPVLWQLPTMGVLLPTVTLLGALATIAHRTRTSAPTTT